MVRWVATVVICSVLASGASASDAPSDARGQYRLGRRQFEAFEAAPAKDNATLRKALVYLRKAIDLSPKEPTYWVTFGQALEARPALRDWTTESSGLPPGRTVPDWLTSGGRLLANGLTLPDEKERKRARDAILRNPCPVVPSLFRILKSGPGAPVADSIGEMLGACWKEEALAAYLRAFQLAKSGGAVSVDAGTRYLQLVRARGVRRAEEPRVREVARVVEGRGDRR